MVVSMATTTPYMAVYAWPKLAPAAFCFAMVAFTMYMLFDMLNFAFGFDLFSLVSKHFQGHSFLVRNPRQLFIDGWTLTKRCTDLRNRDQAHSNPKLDTRDRTRRYHWDASGNYSDSDDDLDRCRPHKRKRQISENNAEVEAMETHRKGWAFERASCSWMGTVIRFPSRPFNMPPKTPLPNRSQIVGAKQLVRECPAKAVACGFSSPVGLDARETRRSGSIGMFWFPKNYSSSTADLERVQL